MSSSVRCPSCGKKYAWKDSLAGKRAKCACGGRVEFPTAAPAGTPQKDDDGPAWFDEIQPLSTAAPASGGRATKSATAATPRGPAASPLRPTPVGTPLRLTQPLGPRQKAWIRFGGTIVLVGIAGLVLPMFGLQLRKIGKAGEAAGPVSVVLILMGLLPLAFVYVGRGLGDGLSLAKRRPGLALAILGGIALLPVLLIVGLVALVVMVGEPERPTVAWNPPPVPYQPAMPAPPPPPPPAYGVPQPPPMSPPAPLSPPSLETPSSPPPPAAPPAVLVEAPPVATGPAAPQPQQPQAFMPPPPPPMGPPAGFGAPGGPGDAALAAQRSMLDQHRQMIAGRFGADRTWLITLAGSRGQSGVEAVLRDKVYGGFAPTNDRMVMTTPASIDDVHIVIGPVDDVAAFAQQLSAGDVVARDDAAHTATIQFDAERLRASLRR